MSRKDAIIYLSILAFIIVVLFTIIGFGSREINRMKSECENHNGVLVKGYGEYICIERK